MLKVYAVEPGMRFGFLEAKSEIRLRKGRTYRSFWICQCVCGDEIIVRRDNLCETAGRRSCGCNGQPKKEAKPQTRHPLRRVWDAMRTRCNNPNSQDYRWYGGRGIKVCERWDDFNVFLEDMGERPPNSTLDRIDPDKDYCPENCRWADSKTQALNRKSTIRVELDGQAVPGWEYCERMGLTWRQFRTKVKAGEIARL